MAFKTALLASIVAVLAVFTTGTAAVAQQQQTGFEFPWSNGCWKYPTVTSGVYNITVNGTQREYLVRLPEHFLPFLPYRLVVALHWYGATMFDVANDTATRYGDHSYFGLLPYAGESSIFVAPNGQNKMWMNTDYQDLAFIHALVDQLGEDLCIAKTERFAVGFSFGASLAYAIANTQSDIFRAVGILSGTDFVSWSGTPAPMPVFVSHGVSDPANPIAKGRLMRDHFIEVNNCTVPSTIEEPVAGSGTHIDTFLWRCTTGKKVEYLAFDGVHQYSPKDAGQTESYLPAKIWEFFMRA